MTNKILKTDVQYHYIKHNYEFGNVFTIQRSEISNRKQVGYNRVR